MATVEELNDRRAELERELSEVKQEIASRHGEVDDPSDRPDNIPVPGADNAGPPPDPRPDPEVDPETGRAVGDSPRDTSESDDVEQPYE